MHILTFDIEDWFNILDHPLNKNYKNWNNLESRIEYSTEIILNNLTEFDVKATFFIVGWFSKKFSSSKTGICVFGVNKLSFNELLCSAI